MAGQTEKSFSWLQGGGKVSPAQLRKIISSLFQNELEKYFQPNTEKSCSGKLEKQFPAGGREAVPRPEGERDHAWRRD
jgi:hypothetical protein